MDNRLRNLGVALSVVALAIGITLARNSTPTPQRQAVAPRPSVSVLPETIKVNQILCSFAKRGAFDTIVAKGVNPFGHSHDFYGNLTIDENSTWESLQNKPTSCAADEPKDTAVYWEPTLIVGGQFVTANPGLRVYYTLPDNAREGSFKKTFPIDKPFPPDFRMIAGSGTAVLESQNPAFVAQRVSWFCYPNVHSKLDSDTGFIEPPITNCKSIGGNRMDIYITFPSCWVGSAARPGDVVSNRPGYEGQVIDSADHKSHVAWPAYNTGACPPTHPVRLPQVKFQAIFRSYDGTTSWSSGPWPSLHADFLNSWNQPRLEEIIAGL